METPTDGHPWVFLCASLPILLRFHNRIVFPGQIIELRHHVIPLLGQRLNLRSRLDDQIIWKAEAKQKPATVEISLLPGALSLLLPGPAALQQEKVS